MKYLGDKLCQINHEPIFAKQYNTSYKTIERGFRFRYKKVNNYF